MSQRPSGSFPVTAAQRREIRRLEALVGARMETPANREAASERIAVLRRESASGHTPSAFERREQRLALRISGLVSMWEAGLPISEIAELTATPAIGSEIERLRSEGHPFPLRSSNSSAALPVGTS